MPEQKADETITKPAPAASEPATALTEQDLEHISGGVMDLEYHKL